MSIVEGSISHQAFRLTERGEVDECILCGLCRHEAEKRYFRGLESLSFHYAAHRC
jgi:hypothetical protein